VELVAGVTVRVPVVLILVPIVLAAYTPLAKKTKEKTTNTAVIETIDLKKR